MWFIIYLKEFDYVLYKNTKYKNNFILMKTGCYRLCINICTYIYISLLDFIIQKQMI